MSKLDKRLLRLIKETKGQFIAVVVVIVIGLAVYTGFNMGIINLETTVNEYYDMTNKSDITVQLVKIPDSKVSILDEIDGIVQYEGRIVNDIFLKGDKDEKVKIRAISQKDLPNNLNQVYLLDGEYIKDKNKDVMVLEMFAKARNIKVGDEVKLIVYGKTKTMNVSAIIASSEYIYMIENEQTLLPDPTKFGVMIVSEEFAKSNFGFGSSYNEVIVRIEDENDLSTIKDDLDKKLSRYGVKRIIDKDDNLSDRFVHEEITQGKKSSNAIPVVFLVVAAVIISVMINRLVKNDRTAIGVFKALGYTNFDLMLHYTKYSLSIGLLGTVFGLILGIYMAEGIALMYTTTVFNIPILIGKLYPEFLFGAVMLGSGFCIVSGLLGARRVLQITPAESMRPAAPAINKRILLERVTFIWKRVSFSWKIVIRNIFRSKKRAIFIIFGIAITFSITLLPIYMMKSFLDMFNDHYGVFQKMDYSINLVTPENEDILNEFKALADIDVIEPKIEFPFEISKGWKKKGIVVYGVLPDTELFTFINLEGEHIILPEDGVVISESMSRFLDIHKGDTVKIKNYLPGRDDVYLPVKDIIQQKLGINMYMDLELMQRELVDYGMISGVFINSDDDIIGAFENVQNISSNQSLFDLKSALEQFLSLTYTSIGIMVVMAGILGFAIVYNSTVMTINERKLEFSSLRVMGFRKNEIFWIIVKENLVMTVVGVIVGIPMGDAMLQSMATSFSNEMYSLVSETDVGAYGISLVLTVLFVLIAQFATYEKIQKLNFIDALKSRIS